MNEFAEKHPDALSALEHWYRLAKKNNFKDFAALKSMFPSADQVDSKTVFNIGGNKYRLIVAIHYNRRKMYISHVLTHIEYDTGKWKRR